MIEIFNTIVAYLTSLEFQMGMLTAAALILLLTLFWTILIACRRSCDCIKVASENGDFIVSRRALYSFFGNALSRFAGCRLTKLVLRKAAKGKYTVRLHLKVEEMTDCLQQEKIRAVLMQELADKLDVARNVARMDLVLVAAPALNTVAEESAEESTEAENL